MELHVFKITVWLPFIRTVHFNNQTIIHKCFFLYNLFFAIYANKLVNRVIKRLVILMQDGHLANIPKSDF